MQVSRKLLSVSVCSLTTLLINIDNTAYQVASPSIAQDMNMASSAVIWIIGAFTLTLASVELYTGWLGDSLGRKRLLLVSLVTYCVGSLVVATSTSVGILLTGRILSGIGGAALVPMGLAILREISSSSDELDDFTSYWGISVGLGLAFGPLIGGVCTEFLGWRSLPTGTALFSVIFLILASIVLPNSTISKNNLQYDLVGVFLVTAFASILTFVLIAKPVLPTIGTFLLLALSGGSLLFVVFRYRCQNRDPLPSPEQRGPLFLPAILAALINYLAFGLSMFVMSVGLLQQHSGISPAATGALLLPVAVGYSLGSRLAPVLMDKLGLPFAFIAPSIVGIATLVVAMAVGDTQKIEYIVPIVGLFLGSVIGSLNTPSNSLAMSQVESAHAGLAGAYASTSRQIGQSLGVALGGLIVSLVSVRNLPVGAVWLPSLTCFVALGLVGVYTLRRNER